MAHRAQARVKRCGKSAPAPGVTRAARQTPPGARPNRGRAARPVPRQGHAPQVGRTDGWPPRRLRATHRTPPTGRLTVNMPSEISRSDEAASRGQAAGSPTTSRSDRSPIGGPRLGREPAGGGGTHLVRRSAPMDPRLLPRARVGPQWRLRQRPDRTRPRGPCPPQSGPGTARRPPGGGRCGTAPCRRGSGSGAATGRGPRFSMWATFALSHSGAATAPHVWRAAAPCQPSRTSTGYGGRANARWFGAGRAVGAPARVGAVDRRCRPGVEPLAQPLGPPVRGRPAPAGRLPVASPRKRRTPPL